MSNFVAFSNEGFTNKHLIDPCGFHDKHLSYLPRQAR
jgi:hypothetical protein